MWLNWYVLKGEVRKKKRKKEDVSELWIYSQRFYSKLQPPSICKTVQSTGFPDE